ncbi:MAG: HIT family protein [Phycisphaerales bacterium]
MPTIFTKIINAEIPCHKIYEDDKVFAFLDINPLSPGHTLVIPKEEAPTLAELSDESAAALGRVLPRLCRAIAKATGTKHCNILQNNGAPAHQAVFHVHFHIIPRPDTGGEGPGKGLGITWPAGKLDTEEAKAMRQKITAALE